jgi:hypothetical protein
MKAHVTAESHWDTHTIAAVMRAFLPEVFAQGQADAEEAKALLGCVVRLTGDRARRAHGAQLVEAEVRDTLGRIISALDRCNRVDESAKVRGLLEEVQRAVAQAQKGLLVIDGPTLSPAEANAQLLFGALNQWELCVYPLSFVDINADVKIALCCTYLLHFCELMERVLPTSTMTVCEWSKLCAPGSPHWHTHSTDAFVSL